MEEQMDPQRGSVTTVHTAHQLVTEPEPKPESLHHDALFRFTIAEKNKLILLILYG